MPLEGRIEKRVPVQIPLYLVRLRESQVAEKVFTENVSVRGARLVTGRSCQPGEIVRVTKVARESYLSARVAYCQPHSGDSFYVGLEYRPPSSSRLAIPQLIPTLVF